MRLLKKNRRGIGGVGQARSSSPGFVCDKAQILVIIIIIILWLDLNGCHSKTARGTNMKFLGSTQTCCGFHLKKKYLTYF